MARVVIPRGESIDAAAADLESHRRPRLPFRIGRGRDSDDMSSGGDPFVIVMTVSEIGHLVTINRQLDNHISSQVRRPPNDETPFRLRGGKCPRYERHTNEQADAQPIEGAAAATGCFHSSYS